jgi:parvulin-like peptidyl-prolyl isomerase
MVRASFVLRSILTLFAAAAFVACGGSGGDEAPSAAGTPSEGTPGSPTQAAAEPAEPPVPDHVVFRVNGAEIRNRQLHGAVETNRLRQQAEGIALDAEGERALREAVMEAAVADELLFQDAKAKGITATPEEIENDLEQVRSRFESKENFERYLGEAGLTEAEVRTFAERRVIVEKHLKALAGGTSVTEAEAKQFYEANKEAFREPEQAKAQIVVVRAAPDDPEPKRMDARKRIDAAHAKAAGGGDMAAIAKEYSQIPNAANGGDLGWFRKGEMFPAIETASFGLPVGSVSDVFETPTGYNFLKVTDRRGSRALPFDEVKARLIVDLGQMKEMQAMERRVGELRGGATIEIVDRSFLEPAGSAAAAAGSAPGSPSAPGTPGGN